VLTKGLNIFVSKRIYGQGTLEVLSFLRVNVWTVFLPIEEVGMMNKDAIRMILGMAAFVALFAMIGLL
jgi:hypothetical protein